LEALSRRLAAAVIPLDSLPPPLRSPYAAALRAATAAAASNGGGGAHAAPPQEKVRAALQAMAAEAVPQTAVAYEQAAADVRDRLAALLAGQELLGEPSGRPFVELAPQQGAAAGPAARRRLFSRRAVASLPAAQLTVRRVRAKGRGEEGGGREVRGGACPHAGGPIVYCAAHWVSLTAGCA
jgi:hypothetical protein